MFCSESEKCIRLLIEDDDSDNQIPYLIAGKRTQLILINLPHLVDIIPANACMLAAGRLLEQVLLSCWST